MLTKTFQWNDKPRLLAVGHWLKIIDLERRKFFLSFFVFYPNITKIVSEKSLISFSDFPLEI